MQSYKIYINKIVVFLVQHKEVFHPGKNKDAIIFFCSKEDEIEKIITAVEIGSITKNLFLVATDIEWLRKTFFSAFKIINAGGCLVQNAKGEYLMMFRKGKWDLPKGKIEKGEDIKAGAIREVEEETGVNHLEINFKLGKTFHTYKLRDKWVLKRTHWFAMRTDFDGEFVPQAEEGIEKVVWVKKSLVKEHLRNSYSSIREVFKMK